MKQINAYFIFILLTIVFAACKQDCKSGEETKPEKPVQRFAMITGLNPEKEAHYRQLHANAWPAVLDKIKDCNIRNYSIYLKQIDGKPFLFSYFEYIGNDFDADMKKMAADTVTQRWWKETDPCQVPLPDAAEKKQIWSSMEEVFRQK